MIKQGGDPDQRPNVIGYADGHRWRCRDMDRGLGERLVRSREVVGHEVQRAGGGQVLYLAAEPVGSLVKRRIDILIVRFCRAT